MFENARDLNIKNSSFTVNVGTAQHDKLDQFLQTAALNAILNAGGRADEVRCYPGTREEVIGKVERWRDGEAESDRRMLWLSGHAGAGKSAIAQTLAERGRGRGLHSANFFFFRGDNTRNHVEPLVATLIYQLIDFYPNLREKLTNRLMAKPLTHKASVGEQFAQLLASPVENIDHSSSAQPQIVLIIDGLDECDDENTQIQILDALHALVSRNGSPFRVMIASRTEPHLVMFFNKIAGSVMSLFLNEEYRPQDDIQKFVAAKFDDIKRTHYLAHTLNENWPTEADINQIASKSSGQFIYAATVIRYIEYSRDSPALSLLTVHQLRPPNNHSPFAQLDALYTHVFAKARDIRATKWALAFHALSLAETGHKILRIVGYETIDLQSLFTDISAIARISFDSKEWIDVEFYHASLPDYLKDRTRSGIYHLDEGVVAADASTACLQKFHDADTLDAIGSVIQYVTQPTGELSKSLLDASKQKLDQVFTHPSKWDLFIRTIIRMYYKTNKVLCKHILRSWVHFAYLHKFDPAVDYQYLSKDACRSYKFLQATEKASLALRHRFHR